ncbi:cobalt-precorrin-6A reductase [Williamsia sterculiae]|uniref:Precorrin-6A/cobalt-precorrin-6A reductase n=1 Tax=Williamsia sterculiae TaxID=1344003 RepID=A0A1N7ENL8_9NOCA|nr:cobalt-precorrin-6A reductase [Williamsia sterculiae]SIR89660.1 precorrin-6A/cobalt-precorrin-6A reductase [Williamsia sterculiae]
MTVLILGGTGEARDLARQLTSGDRRVVSSLAGRVRDPALPQGDVRVGGFGGADGMARWLREHRVDAVVDATHPFAQQISENATVAAWITGVPLVVLRRPPWEPRSDDRWSIVPDITAAASAVSERGDIRVFLTTGRRDLAVFADNDRAWFLIRVVDPPDVVLPRHSRVIRDRGPYRLPDERRLLIDNRIDVLVTKNSGGTLTEAKLDAARELGVPVIMVARPDGPSGVPQVATVDAAVEWLDTVG